MKRLFAALVALALVCGFALADAVVGDGGDSWLRSGPGLSYAKLNAVLEDGESAEYLGSTSYDGRGVAWYYVRTGGATGWVSSRYTALEQDVWTDGWDEDVLWVRATARVNLRSGPGTSYDDLGVLVEGECLRYLDQTRYDANGRAWYRAEYYSYGEVWVSSRYSELTYERTYAESDDDACSFGSYIQTTGRLNVRSGPGLDFSELGTLDKGATATYLDVCSVDERGVTWYKISYNGGTGWVSSRYCELH